MAAHPKGRAQLPLQPPSMPIWFIRSLDEVKALLDPVRREVGFALREAQKGAMHPNAKPPKGYNGASVLEIVEDHDKEAYRAVYTVQFEDVIYVLHAYH